MEETWSESPLPWTFEYTGGEHVIIDGKHKGLIVGERPDLFVFIWVPSTSTSLSFYSFAVNLKSEDVIATEVNSASDSSGTQNKGGV